MSEKDLKNHEEQAEAEVVVDSSSGRAHKPLYMVVIITTVVIYTVAVIFNYLASQPGAVKDSGLYQSSTGNISDKFYVEITPAGWTFGVVWATIYVWMAVGMIYGLSTLCRRGPFDGYLYTYPPLTPLPMYGFLIFNLVLNVSWIFMWDREIIDYTVIIISLMTASLYGAIFVTARACKEHLQEFVKFGKCSELWMVRMMLHNAMGFYATWLSIATLLNFFIALTYRANAFSQTIASTVLLSILSVEILLWFILDMFALDKYVRYLFSPYIVLCLALSGSLNKNWTPGATNSIFTAVILGVVAVFTIAKLIVMLWRHFKKPLTILPV